MNQQNVLLFGVTAHGNSNQQKNYFPETSFFIVCHVHLLPCCLYPLEVLAAGIQQFIGNRSSSKGMPLSQPSAWRSGWGSWDVRALSVRTCAVSLHPVPSIDAHITSRIQWKTDLLLAKLHCFQKAWWESEFVDVFTWGEAVAGIGCSSFSVVVLLVQVNLGNTSSRQRYPLGYAKKLLLLVLRTISILWLPHKCLD